MGSPRDCTVSNNLVEGRARLRRRIALPAADDVKVFQFPRGTVRKLLFETVSGTHYGISHHRLRLATSEEENRRVDVAFAMAHHARHQSGRLERCQPLFGHAGVQTAIGLIDGNRGIHDF